MPKSKEQAKAFATEYIKNGLNATKAVKTLEPDLINRPKYANVKASRALASPTVQRAIAEILEEKGVSKDFLATILRRNIKQEKNISASNQGIDIANKMLGIYSDKEEDTKPIFNIVIEELSVKKQDTQATPTKENPL